MELSKLRPEINEDKIELVRDVDERPKGMAKIIEDDPIDVFPNETEI